MAQVETPGSLLEDNRQQGVRAGSIRIYPTLTFDSVYDTDIYNRESDAVDDLVFVVRPSIVVQPDLARHDVRLSVAGVVRRYTDTTEENSEQLAADLSYRAELRGGVDVTGHLLAAKRIERRGTFGDKFQTDRPAEFDEFEASMGISRARGRLELSARGSINKKSYDDSTQDGIVLDQSFRDLKRYRGSVRATYKLSPRVGLFVQGSANRIDYRVSTGTPRDSKGYSVLGGVRFDLGDLVKAEAGLGYLKQKFDDPAEPDLTGIDYYVAGTWTPTPRIQFSVQAERNVVRSPLTLVSAIVESEIGISTRYVVDEKTEVGTEASRIRASYRGIDRTETRHTVGATVRRQLRRSIAVTAGASYRKQTSATALGRQYDGLETRVGLSWTL